MKIQLDKNEVYIAVQVYLLLKGYFPTGSMTQKYTNHDGMLFLDVDVEKYDKSSEEVLEILKQKKIL